MEQIRNTENVDLKENIKSKKKLIIIAAILIICGIIGLVLFLKINKESYIKESYIEKLETIRFEMLESSGDAEFVCNLTNKVWYNSIYEEFDEETDKYTTYKIIENIYGSTFFNDFETSLKNLYQDKNITEKISNIKEAQKAVKSLIKNLQNPPKELEDCYDVVLSMYDYYKSLTDLAINPTGNLEDYSDNKNDAIDGFIAEYEKLDNIMP